MDRSRGPLTLVIVGAAAFVVLSVLVATHVTHGLDVSIRGYFRPHDEWGPKQIRADVIVEDLKPRYMALLLALVGIGASLRRKSWRPLVYSALIGGTGAVLTLSGKLLLRQPDPHNYLTWTGGSFPSGHTVSVLVCLGGAVLILHECSRWWEWAVVTLVGLAMGVSLLLQAAHWFTDVLGGLLLGITVLAAMSMSSFRGPPPREY